MLPAGGTSIGGGAASPGRRAEPGVWESGGRAGGSGGAGPPRGQVRWAAGAGRPSGRLRLPRPAQAGAHRGGVRTLGSGSSGDRPGRRSRHVRIDPGARRRECGPPVALGSPSRLGSASPGPRAPRFRGGGCGRSLRLPSGWACGRWGMGLAGPAGGSWRLVSGSWRSVTEGGATGSGGAGTRSGGLAGRTAAGAGAGGVVESNGRAGPGTQDSRATVDGGGAAGGGRCRGRDGRCRATGAAAERPVATVRTRRLRG